MIVTVTSRNGEVKEVDKCDNCPYYHKELRGLDWCGNEMMDIADSSVIPQTCPFNYKGNFREGTLG